MIKNLPVLVLLVFVSIGCREVFMSNENKDLSHIPFSPTAYSLHIPKGLPQMPVPEDNPMTIEGVELGGKLFFDPILSADSTMSCVSCHFPELGFTDGKALSTGIDGITGRRSSMSLVNVGYNNTGLFWDGRVKTLEEQALIPVEDEIELHNSWDTVVSKLNRHSDYPILFRKAFGIASADEIDKLMVVKAIAQFERTLISGNSKFDQVMRGEAEFTEDEEAGYDIYFDETFARPDGECGHCHNVPLMTTNEYLNNGIDPAKTINDFKDPARGAISGYEIDMGKFRVPTLRNIELTAPYMHDGRFQTLEEVIEHYNSGGHNSENVSPLIRPLKLKEVEKRQILAFLKTLTDSTFVESNKQNFAKFY